MTECSRLPAAATLASARDVKDSASLAVNGARVLRGGSSSLLVEGVTRGGTAGGEDAVRSVAMITVARTDDGVALDAPQLNHHLATHAMLPRGGSSHAVLETSRGAAAFLTSLGMPPPDCGDHD